MDATVMETRTVVNSVCVGGCGGAGVGRGKESLSRKWHKELSRVVERFYIFI